MENKNITIIGAGLAGSLLAVYLARCGFKVDVFEKRPDPRKDPTLVRAAEGRSINLALSARGIHALKEVGIYDEIAKLSIPMYGRMVHTPGERPMFQPYGKDPSEHINAVSRAELNRAIINSAESYPGIRFHFDTLCTGMDFLTGEVFLRKENSSEILKSSAVTTIAADGVPSAIRMEMLKLPRFDFSQEYENYGYKELTIPPGPGGSFLIEKNALHIWPRGSYMLIALPNLDGSFTCTLFFPYDGELSFASLDSEKKVLDFFKEIFPDAFALMPNLLEEFFSHPVGHLLTIKCHPWSYQDKVAMLGDASHAIVPFFGQGMNAAFEDCTILNELIAADLRGVPTGSGRRSNLEVNWKNVFEAFQNARKVNTDAIAELARENFIEMRDLVAQPRFQLKKKIENELAKKYPKIFIPKYSMVSFHRIPYSVVLQRGRRQERILHQLSEGITTLEQVNWKLAEDLVRSNLSLIAYQ